MKSNAILVVILVAALVFPTLVGAQGENLPGSGWWTGQQIQNIGTAGATIVSTAYDANSSLTYPAVAGPIDPGKSATFLPGDFTGMPDGFQGSAVVASDQPIKAIVNLTNRQVGSYGVAGGLAGGQYQGVDGSAAATSVFFPIVKNAFNSKSTTLFVQNAGSAAATVNFSFVCGASSYPWASPSQVGPGQMVVANASAAGVPNGTLCSATATSLQQIAGVASEHYATETTGTLVQATRGFTPGDGATTIYAPIYKNRYPLPNPDFLKGRTSGAQVQNVSGAVINNVHATIYGSGGTCTGQTYTADSGPIQNGASYVFLEPAGMPQGCNASAVFESSGGNIVGIVNESFLRPSIPGPGTQSATAYNMLRGGTAATTKLAIPLYKEMFGNKTSGIQVQNIGTGPTDIYAVFSNVNGTWTTVNYTVQQGASYPFFMMSTCGAACWVGGSALPANQNVGVTIYSSSQNILAIVNEAPYYATNQNCFGQNEGVACYDRQNYEGFSVNP